MQKSTVANSISTEAFILITIAIFQWTFINYLRFSVKQWFKKITKSQMFQICQACNMLIFNTLQLYALLRHVHLVERISKCFCVSRQVDGLGWLVKSLQCMSSTNWHCTIRFTYSWRIFLHLFVIVSQKVWVLDAHTIKTYVGTNTL